MTAAFAIGMGRHALSRAVAYARERTVWSAPIGAHQAIAHPLAQAHIDLELARLMTQKAAHLYDAGDDAGAGEAANMAKYAAAEACVKAVDQAVHTLGGNGLARVRARLADHRRARVPHRPGEPGDDPQLRLPPDPGPAQVVLGTPAPGRPGGTVFRSEYADVPPVELPIHEAVLGRAAEFGGTPALIDGTDGTTLTYEQVDRFHRRVAAGLAEAGVRKGDVLALHSPNTIAFPTAFYAATRARAPPSPPCTPWPPPRSSAGSSRTPPPATIVTVSPLLETARRAAELAGGIEEILT
ncbi:hypothetical protein STENM327S_08565 [Streptomyces tendae]